MNQLPETKSNAAGFSLIELIIAMTTTIVMLAIASTVLSSAFKIRAKQDAVTDSLADAQRALNIMSREIANAGFDLQGNGVVAGDSDSNSIRIRSNLNHYDTSPGVSDASRANVQDPGEDVKYFINAAPNTNYLVRYDANAVVGSGQFKSTVLANRMDSLGIHYFAQKVSYQTADCDITNPSSAEVTPDAAGYIVIAACVRLPAFGAPNTAGYQPATNVLLVSDVTLRNAGSVGY
jgi:type II secretory pathway pseudopilin PulG